MSNVEVLEREQRQGALLEGVRDPAIAVQRRRTAVVFTGRIVLLLLLLGLW